jgi:hypothetical protein
MDYNSIPAEAILLMIILVIIISWWKGEDI